MRKSRVHAENLQILVRSEEQLYTYLAVRNGPLVLPTIVEMVERNTVEKQQVQQIQRTTVRQHQVLKTVKQYHVQRPAVKQYQVQRTTLQLSNTIQRTTVKQLQVQSNKVEKHPVQKN